MGEVEASFVEAARGRGLVIRSLVADGQIHRCEVEGKEGKEVGWYLLHSDGVASGAFGNWADGQGATKWSFRGASSEMSAAEVQAYHAAAAAAGKVREAARAKEAVEAAARALSVVEDAAEASGSFGYLATKGVEAAAGSYRKGSTLILPLKDATGAVVNLQRIWWERESERWIKTYEKGAKRAGTYHVIKGSASTVAICEGYSTGLSIHAATGWSVLCAMDSGQLMAVAKMARAKAPKAEIVMASDDDWANDRNAGLEAAKVAAEAVGARLVVPKWPEGHPERGTDWNDAHSTLGLEAVREGLMGAPVKAAKVAKVAPQEVEPVVEVVSPREMRHPMPDGWREERGHLLRKVVTAKGKVEWVSVCYPAIWVKGRAVSLETRDHYVTLAHGHQLAEGEEVPAAEACQARLLVGWRRKGLPVSSNTAKVLVDYIDGALALMDQDEAEALSAGRKPKWPTVALASSTGWLSDGSAFVRGFDGVHFAAGVASMDLRMGLLEGEQRDTVKAVVASGTVQGWRAAVEPVLREHPRAAYAMAAAVVPPLLRFFAPVGSAFALDLSGNSSVGKTTALKLAASIWGTGRIVGNWKDTNTASERIAGAMRGLPIFRDESQLADDLTAAGNWVYEITQGRGKARGTITGTQKSATYESVLISTGETPLAGMREAGGLVARCVTVWGPIFGKDSAETKKALQAAAKGVEVHHGAAGAAFVDHVIATSAEERAELRAMVERKAAVYALARPPAMSGTEAIQRIALYLAEMEVGWWLFRKAVGLEWEAQSEISDLFSKSELEAILAKGAEADKAAHAIEGVVAWVASNRARMQWHANAPENSMPIIGRMREEKGERAVYLVPDALHDYLKGRGLNVKATVATFLDRGELVKGEGRSTHKIYLGGGSPWCYRLSRHLSELCGEEHDRGGGSDDDEVP